MYYMLHPVDGGCPAKKLRTDNIADKHVFRAMNNVTVTCLWSDAKGCQVFVQYRDTS
ncbi:hypothetical protein F7725_012236 [Dissostichus mawsoni]|uniref:Uncharacterized protein n=1 Tax=Dissostichus mawsoni TaxID=36200 RepID=A0A7J5YLT1_DISMA|nr:hypothetical protein F7725_012236 [Dissostichus mawsoni]